MLHVKRTGKGTILTVINYDNFQGQGTKVERKKGQKESGSGTGLEHKQIMNNKDKRNKEEKDTLSPEEKKRRMIERQKKEEEEDLKRILGELG